MDRIGKKMGKRVREMVGRKEEEQGVGRKCVYVLEGMKEDITTKTVMGGGEK